MKPEPLLIEIDPEMRERLEALGYGGVGGR